MIVRCTKQFGILYAVVCFGMVTSELHGRSKQERLSRGKFAREKHHGIEFEIEENFPVGTLVGTIPVKPGYTYKFNENPREFALNATTGRIETTVVVDREALVSDRFDLVVLSSSPIYVVDVTIKVKDVNDNPPRFPEPVIRISFSETASVGTRVILDTASDSDLGTNGITKNYCIVSGNEDERFKLAVTLNPSGDAPYLHLETVSLLDRENRNFYQLNISAEDGGNPKLHGYLSVEIDVLDVNDNPPIFDHSDYVVSLNESVPPGTRVLQVTATDNDVGDNSRLTYYLSDDQVSQFAVDPQTGVITTSKRLECRRGCGSVKMCHRSCVFTVFARDHGTPKQDGRTYVTVNLLDTNDQSPVIQFRYFPADSSFATVDENAQNGSVVAVVSVTDDDEGENGQVDVSIQEGNELGHFRLHTTPGFNIVRVNNVLDREKINSYNLTFVATDRGVPPRRTVSFLEVFVNDINDHEPVFDKSEYAAVVSEAVSVFTYICSVKATDADTGVNAKVVYGFASGNELRWFHIDPSSGLITTSASLDREKQDAVTLKISARDSGPNPKWSYSYLKVQILDENDQHPSFDSDRIVVNVTEELPENSLVSVVKAFDSDQGTNGSIDYVLHATTEDRYPGYFHLDAANGHLYNKLLLDREKHETFYVEIIAKDNGIPSLSSTATVLLNLIDVNDNNPKFYPVRYMATISSQVEAGSALLKVEATDNDDGKNAELHYSIVRDEDELFSIDETTGAIYSKNTVKAKETKRYRIIVTVEDGGGRKAEEDAIVDVFVTNSKQLSEVKFGQDAGYAFAIREDVLDGEIIVKRFVGRVSAMSRNGQLTYSILDGDRGNAFHIDERKGDIKTVKKLDREEKEFYSLQVVAEDQISFASTVVNVTVEDVNDNTPRFTKRVCHIHVQEDVAVGSELYRPEVFDPDTGDDSYLFFDMHHDSADVFRIDDRTGAIRTNSTLNSLSSKLLKINITASDSGRFERSSWQMLEIFVDDVNDHTPTFTEDVYEISLLESVAINERFIQLKVLDDDAGMNREVSFRLVSGNTREKFGIFPDGSMFVRDLLDREKTNYHLLTVEACDRGEPRRSSTASVIVHVIDVNDNPPAFRNSTFEFDLNENESPDSFVGQVSASDPDQNKNADLIYKLKTQDKTDFLIGSKNGIIRSLKTFDREKMIKETGSSEIFFEAVVFDCGVPKLSDVAKIIVRIQDVNDNPPSFLDAPYLTQISEETSVGSQIIRISAADPDSDFNGDMIYEIVPETEENHFAINAITGQVTLHRPVDRETNPSYKLQIVARDAGQPVALSSSMTLTIEILDENDNFPVFKGYRQSIVVPESLPVGSVLEQFHATDSDAGKNSEIVYYLGANGMHDPFRIDAKSGILSLERPLDYETQKAFQLNVTANDCGFPSKQMSIRVTVQVQDVNDNSPVFPATAIVRQIEENIPVGTGIVTVTAEDPDSESNGRIRYKLGRQEPPGRHFGIDEDSGLIFTLSEIDREFADTFRLSVVASDQAEDRKLRLSSEKLVTVIVDDVNDNAPIFDSLSTCFVRQDNFLMSVHAMDADAGSNGLVTYELIEGNRNLFHLNRTSGALYVRDKSRLESRLYRIIIRATDEAVHIQRKSSETYVTIVGKGTVGAGLLSFPSNYSASFYENEPVGTKVTVVSAEVAHQRNPMKIEYHLTSLSSNSGETVRCFDIDTKTGIVSTTRSFDRESGSFLYDVEVHAVAYVEAGIETAKVTLRVEILDVNDTPPKFKNSSVTFVVNENFIPGQFIGKITAVDKDISGQISYSIVNSTKSDFSIDPTTGTLTLSRNLDREMKPNYSLMVKADDGIQHSEIEVKIQVEDSNDNPPYFSEYIYSFDVHENTEKGSEVGPISASDPDEGPNGQVSYSIISEWANEIFSINTQTGTFILTSRLDYEQEHYYLYVVLAQDSGQPSLSSTVTVHLNVIDVNDNSPIFDPMSYSDEVFENVTINTHLLQVTATDQDSGDRGRIEYFIESGNENSTFSIFENGTIYTRLELDREVRSVYNLIVVAVDKAVLPEIRLSSSAQVTIYVRDINDEAPNFVSPSHVEILESTPVNSVIMAIKALDRDEGRNGYVEYSLEPGSPFVLGLTDGLLRLSQSLDHELCANYTLNIVARDRGYPSLSSAQKLFVSVLDENDNDPIFDPRKYSVLIAENTTIGTTVVRVSATDIDEIDNDLIHYSISSGDPNFDFSLDEENGVLRVARSLNRERKSRYILSVKAEDRGGRTDTASITVLVSDVNDNVPIFNDSPYIVYVKENNKNIPLKLMSVHAHDADGPPFNKVNYFLREGDKDLFSLNSTSGELILMQELDREENSIYMLTIVAVDNGIPRMTGTGTVKVIVQDVNDHAPEFDMKIYKAYIQENLPSNTSVLSVRAKDKDLGINAIVRYGLLTHKDKFSINPVSGEIKTLESLDREFQSLYSLHVTAWDSNPSEQFSSSVNVSIYIKDVNDNPPMFDQKLYQVCIRDQHKLGDFVFGIAASDADSGDNGDIEYTLFGKDSDYFSIHKRKGTVAINRRLPKNQNMFNISVRATDFGKERLNSFAELITCQAPSVLFPQVNYSEKLITVAENSPFEKILTVSGLSPKSHPKSTISYSLIGMNSQNEFQINRTTGEFSILSGLDREIHSVYDVWVSVSDSDDVPLATFVLLRINVTDENDNVPLFDSAIYRLKVSEDEPASTIVGSIVAFDPDERENGRIKYRLVGENTGAFHMDENKGLLRTARNLDREKIPFYSFMAEASDGGEPSLTSTVSVIVEVLDKNDNPPRFTRLFSVNITENAPVGTYVIRITSSDKDIGQNAVAVYSLTENPGNKFAINSSTGVIVVSALFDREEKEEYLLKVSAEDGAWRAETPLTISIQDENDNRPEFTKAKYVFNVSESTSQFIFVGRLAAFDNDKLGPNSLVYFSLKQKSTIFTVDPQSGEIFSKRPLQYKKTKMEVSPENQYILNIVATDNGLPPLSNECEVVINVIDANNNPPKISRKQLHIPVVESLPVGYNIILINVTDNDSGINSEIEYTVSRGNASSFLKLDRKTGWLIINSTVKNNNGNYYHLGVQACDKGIPQLCDEVNFTFIITGENKFDPEFSAYSYQVSVPENERLESVLLTIKATDRDEGVNGKIYYWMEENSNSSVVHLNEETGVIVLKQPLDYEQEKRYEYNITASDRALFPRITKATLTVVVTDVNDSPPVFNSSKFDVLLTENLPYGAYVYTLVALDNDSSPNAVIRYSIIGGDGKEYFSINQETGIVTSLETFDFEKKNLYILDILATNPGTNLIGITKLLIHIKGVNEYFPKFMQSVFRFSIPESSPIGTSVGRIIATDNDRGEDGIVYYYFIGYSNDKGFLIEHETGVIKVSHPLDRELQNRVVLTVLAKNYGSIRGNDTDEGQVIILIQDDNDPPVFKKEYYDARISEDSPVNTEIITLLATDKDTKAPNNQFHYKIISHNNSLPYKIHPITGVVTTSSQLDREEVERYSIVIAAIDNGNPQKTGTTSLVIYLEDVNDNAPSLKDDDLIGYILENEQAMTTVMKFSAFDRDAPPNGSPFHYYLVGGKHKSYFKLDRVSGTLVTLKSLDREATPELFIQIKVEDSGNPKQFSQFEVKIIVLDKNDVPSTPRKTHIKVFSFHEKFYSGKIADISPLDQDITGNYQCSLTNQIPSQFFVPNGCELHGNVVDFNSVYNLTSFGNDGLHNNVLSTFSIEFHSLDNTTLKNVVVLSLSNCTPSAFLQNFYEKFVNVVQNLFLRSKILLLLSSSHDNNTNIFLLVYDGKQLKSSNDVKKTIIASERKLQTMFGSRNLIIDTQLCESFPCENYGKCSETLSFSLDVVSVSSDTLIVTSPSVHQVAICKCLDNFFGSKCELKKDPCFPNPCSNNVPCIHVDFDFQCQCPPHAYGKTCNEFRNKICEANSCNNGGSCQEINEDEFFCLCRAGFQGKTCDVISDSCRLHTCFNGGNCLDLHPGYTCLCPPNYYGTQCEKSSFGFGELSYLAYPKLDGNTNDISVTFATNKKYALLVYNYGISVGGRSDFIALEIFDGRPRFSYGTIRTAVASVELDRDISDGKWHKINAIRNGKVISISLSDCSNGDNCTECDFADFSCYADNHGSSGTLNFDGNSLFVGGIPSIDSILERPGQVNSNDFVGCMGAFFLNGRALNFKKSIDSFGITDTCPRNFNPCENNPCSKEGKCFDVWNSHMCQCSNGLFFKNCAEEINPVVMQGSFISFKILESYRRHYLYPDHHEWKSPKTVKYLSFLIRTIKSDAVLFWSSSLNNFEYTIVKIKDGILEYVTKNSKNSVVTMADLARRKIDNGKWNNITLASDGESFMLLLNGDLVGEELDIQSIHDFIGPHLTHISIGGISQEVESENISKYSDFHGCVSTLVIDGMIQSLIEPGPFLHPVHHGIIQNGCVSDAFGASISTDPLNIGITLIIIFFVTLMVGLMISLVVFRFRKQLKEKNFKHGKQNGIMPLPSEINLGIPQYTTNGVPGDAVPFVSEALRSQFQQDFVNRRLKEITERPPRPDVLERETNLLVSKSEHSVRPPIFSPASDVEYPEHYDLENSSSIAPSDIDVIFHYRGYRDEPMKKYKPNPRVTSGAYQHSHRHSPRGFPPPSIQEASSHNLLLRQGPNIARDSPTALKMQTTPLARLSPSSELSHPRILTLQDISGKPLQRTFLASSQGTCAKDAISTSEHSLNSPISRLSPNSDSVHNQSHGDKLKASSDHLVIPACGISRIRSRTCSLVSTLDGISDSSESSNQQTSVDLRNSDDSSSEESGNDSFTCSEIEYENNYDKLSKDLNTSESMLVQGTNRLMRNYPRNHTCHFDCYESFRGSLNTLITSDDERGESDFSSNKNNNPSYKWDYLLNWGPNFKSLMEVFKDIAQLPDTSQFVESKNPSEEYV